MSTDRKRDRPDHGEILNQDGKVFIGTLNPNKSSFVRYIYENEKGKKVCSAFQKDGFKICTRVDLYENGRCTIHGGRTPIGADSPHFKTGKFSAHLPERLRERYEEALADDALQDFTEDLALIETRLADLFTQLDTGGGREIFAEIQDAYKAFKYANIDGDKKAMREALRRLDEGIDRGGSEGNIWGEIHMLQEQRRKIVLSQAKHLQITNQMIPVKKVNILVSALLDSVRQNVLDPAILEKINDDFLRFTGAGRERKELTA